MLLPAKLKCILVKDTKVKIEYRPCPKIPNVVNTIAGYNSCHMVAFLAGEEYELLSYRVSSRGGHAKIKVSSSILKRAIGLQYFGNKVTLDLNFAEANKLLNNSR